MSGDFRPCAVVPTYDNPRTVEGVVAGLREHLDVVVVVDDGSGPEGRAAAQRLAGVDGVDVTLLERNRGKGHAVMAGFARAKLLGCTHALQVDADGQHRIDDVPRFLDEARARPDALIAGVPIFGPDAPRSRVVGRRISIFWVDLEVGRGVIGDPLYGFRVYPLDASLAAAPRSLRMGFDTDIAVRMVWGGTPVLNLPTAVRYLTAEQGGVSHFKPFASNVALSKLHTRLFWASLWWRLRGGRRRITSA